MSTSARQTSWESQLIPVDQLRLDPHNSRLIEFGLGDNPSDDAILAALWKNMAVDELALSIATNGFYRHEPLYATRERGRLLVVEGNRRLAAVKLLRDEHLQSKIGATGLPRIGTAARSALETLPVIVCERRQIWSYLGFKHINGPQAWESYPKASYIAWVHNELDVSLEQIAQRIGDKHSTVARLYDALMVLQQAENESVFNREDRYKRHFSFSHLTTGLGYAGIQMFLGLPRGDKTIGKRRPVPRSHVRQLGELLTWLYGRKPEDVPPVVESQNPDLRILDQVLKSKDGTIALRKGLPLSVSLEISKGDERVFREALVGAKQNLQKARGTVLTGYDGNKDLLDTAGDIAELIGSLLQDMRGKSTPDKQRAQARGK